KTSDLSKERKVEKRLFGNFFGAMFGALFALMTWELSTEVINRLTIDDRLFGVLKWFMNNYNPDLNIKSDKNLKKCLPEGLYSTFDNMYLEYLKNGDKYLRNRALEIVRNLRSKIMYEIKKEEYKKPKVVNVYNSSYSHPIYTYPTYRYSRYGY
ncbi:hypothetical protein L6269_03700, partial [Candidatus Dependentiae bacterium]|nr:hypothetical protein [Candidatus Dependentiae bacterium]